MANEDIAIRITAKDDASNVLKKVGDNVGGLGSKFATLAKIGIAGAMVGLGALAAIGYSSVKAFSEQEKATAQLEAVLKSTAGAAGVTSKAAQDLATSLQKTTTYADETVLAAENTILTFTKVSSDIFPDTTRAVLDLSTAMGQDLKSSAIQIGKALNNPIEGVGSLTRVGVQFTAQQKEQIKTLVETGHTLDAQRIILKELNTEFGGSAAAAAETFGGKMMQLKNIVSELQETIGKAIVGAILPFITSLANWASSDDVQTKIEQISKGIADFGKELAYVPEHIRNIINAITEWWNNLITFNPVAIAIIGALRQAWETIWKQIKEGLIPAFMEFKDMIEPHMPIIIEFVKALGIVFGGLLLGALLVVIKAVTALHVLFISFLSTGINLATTIGSVLVGAFEAIVKIITTAIEMLEKFINTAKKISDVPGKVGSSLSNIGNKIGQFFIGKQAGGQVSANRPFLVGEGGPELFVPGQTGTILPSKTLAGIGGGVIINITGTFMSDDAAKKMANKMIDALKFEMRI